MADDIHLWTHPDVRKEIEHYLDVLRQARGDPDARMTVAQLLALAARVRGIVVPDLSPARILGGNSVPVPEHATSTNSVTQAPLPLPVRLPPDPLEYAMWSPVFEATYLRDEDEDRQGVYFFRNIS